MIGVDRKIKNKCAQYPSQMASGCGISEVRKIYNLREHVRSIRTTTNNMKKVSFGDVGDVGDSSVRVTTDYTNQTVEELQNSELKFVLDPTVSAFTGTLQTAKCKRKCCSVMVTVGHPYCTTCLREVLGLRIAKSTIPNSGFGLFAEKYFKLGQRICPYVGEKLSKKEMKLRYKTPDKYAPYAVTAGDSVIDAALKRGVGAMANTIDAKQKSTNAVFKESPTDGNNVWIYATSNIRKGMEIFVEYGPDDLTVSEFTSHRTMVVH